MAGIPKGIQRDKMARSNSVGSPIRIKLGGELGDMCPVMESDVNKNQRNSLPLNSENLTFDDLDTRATANSALYSRFRNIINNDLKKLGIPSTYPWGMEWTCRNTMGLDKVVNTLRFLLVLRKAGEDVIFDKDKKIDLLQKELRSAEKKIKELSEVLGAKEKIFRYEATFREEKMNKQLQKLTEDVAITKKAKTDVERNHKLIQKQKRNLVIQDRKIQQLHRNIKRNFDEFRNIKSNFDELKVENKHLRSELEDFKQKHRDLIKNEWIVPHHVYPFRSPHL